MLFRYYTKCPGCNSKILLRISVGIDIEQPFYYVCSNCNGASRGKLIITYKPHPDAKLELEEGELYEMLESCDQSINIHSDLPSIPDAGEMWESGGSPFLNFVQLLGSSKNEEFLQRIHQFRSCIKNDWNSLRRIINYYLDKNWRVFDKQIQHIIGNDWPDNPSALARHDALHKLMDIMTAPLWVNLYYPEMKEDWNLKFNQSIKEQQTSLNNFLQQDGLVDEINNLQRDLFHCFELLIDNKSSFLPALPVEMLTKDGKQASNLRLFRDDFPLLRDIYITTFESCHKTLKYIVAIINIAHRGDPNKFYRNNPNNLNRFSKLPNAKKVEPLKELEVWYQLWNTILNRPMRNAIGHHGICHDLSSGMLLLKNEEKIPYLDFVVQCFGLMHPLLACCNALKTYRIGLSLN